MKRRYSTLAVAGIACLGLHGCGGGDDQTAAASPAAPVDALSACNALGVATVDASLIALPTRGAKVTSATLVPPSTTNPSGEFCLLQGQITSVDPAAQPINFNVAMPSRWNGKLAHLGGGSWDGEVVPATLGTIEQFLPRPTMLGRGYVAFGSDSGHSEFDASFGLNDEQLRNFGGDQLKKTRDTVLQLTKMRYAAAPTKTYFIGGSNGGREAMAAMQRWPQDYDGIVNLFPALAWTPLFMKMQQIGRAMRSNGGVGWIDAGKAATLRAATLAACDELDGLKDGIISNVNACAFDATTLRCPRGVDAGDQCFSDAQLNTISVMESRATLPYALANGVSFAPNYLKGADWSAAGFLGTTSAFSLPPDPDALGYLSWFGDSLVRYVLMRDANADTLQFDPLNPGALLPRLQQASSILDATNPDIQSYLNKGGKLIMIHGLSDQLVAAQPTIDYYQTLVEKYGPTEIDKAVRFYLIPGYAHATGLSFNANGGMPLVDALEDWVERDIAPETLTAVDSNAGSNSRTRPMCVYPKWPRYKGTGDPNHASNFSCVVN